MPEMHLLPGYSAATHEVTNQVPALVDTNIYLSDRFLRDGVARYDGSWGDERLTAFGARLGSSTVLQWADQANRFDPELKTHDRTGHRIDEVEFHPAWHELMALSTEFGVHNLPWSEERPGAHVVRAAMMFMAYQTEAGHCCPISMTYSAVPALRKQPDLAEIWEPRILQRAYDGRLMEAGIKPGVIFGMAMTEKQGGSDVRANSTVAVPFSGGGPGKEYLITGHKWFCSAPMSDAFLVLAQIDGQPSCFLVPRILPDGSRNVFQIQRLKEKLGNRSNASSEIEFRNTIGYLVGGVGRGVPTIIEMVNHTRLDCAIGSASLMRQSLVQAMHHGRHRSAFGKSLKDQPLMRSVFADLAVEAEAAQLLMLRLAHSYDNPKADDGEDAFRRITSAVSKYWLCKRATPFVGEALECLGGNGYVEESVMPRLFRESPLNSIWEGAGNVICLDVMRALVKEPQSIAAIESELHTTLGESPRYHRYARAAIKALHDSRARLSSGRASSKLKAELEARANVERVAISLMASLMIRYSSPEAAEAYISSRLGRSHGYMFGTMKVASRKIDAILERYLETV